MRKIVSILLAISFCICVTGCKKVEKGESSSEGSSDTTQSNTSSNISNDGSSDVSSDISSTDTPVTAPVIIGNLNFSEEEKLDNKRRGWGQGYSVNKETNRPLTCDQYQTSFGKYGGLFIDEKAKKEIHLTFDEGYENGYTPKILDVLKEKNVKATFFVTYDYVKAEPDLVKRMIAEGHAVGNHSMKHKSMPSLSTKENVSEIMDLHNYVLKNFNYTMTSFRPPKGEWSIRTVAIAKKLGYSSVFWSFAYLDYDVKKQPDPTTAFKRITSAAHPGGIYLLHAVSKTNTEILGKVIDDLQSQGYSITKLGA